jgi:hypothetical protein
MTTLVNGERNMKMGKLLLMCVLAGSLGACVPATDVRSNTPPEEKSKTDPTPNPNGAGNDSGVANPAYETSN